MTREKFRKRYPNGLNVIIVSFLKSLHHVMTTDEIDKVIKHCKSWRERRWLKAFKKNYRANAKEWDTMPIWAFLPNCKSSALLQDIIAVMATANKNCYYGNEEEIDETEE